MKDLEIKIGVRNNQIKERRENMGLSQKMLGSGAGVYCGTINAFECMRERPTADDGEWTKAAKKLATFFDVDPAELWPEALRDTTAKTVVRKVDVEDFVQLVEATPQQYLPAPEQAIDRDKLRDRVEDVLKTLTPREVEVLELRFGFHGVDEQTLVEAGKKLRSSVTSGRVQQLESRALRSLRHPSRSKHLEPFLPDDHFDDPEFDAEQYQEQVEEWQDRCNQAGKPR